MLRGSGNSAAPYISSRPFNGYVGSSASFQLAGRWLVECSEGHEECRSLAGGFCPTRLVDLKRGLGLDFVKVVSSWSLRPTRETVYATLSYCWGGDQAIKTLRSTLQSHQAGIKISSLSQTLQDAIKVARSLRVEFLWIDSLCIVQDDPRDVTEEISRMSDYYENAFICISAASASSCNEGFLQPRSGNPYHHGPFELPYRGPDNSMGSIKLVTYADYSSALEPAKARAWIMQESLLAPRLLSYSYRNLAWSCRRVNCSDGGPYRPAHGWHDFKERENWRRSQREDAHSHESFSIKYWKELVQSYSRRGLTVPEDKFPALSAVAQKYAHTNSSLKYLAGLWHNTSHKCHPLFSQLFWTTPLYEFRFSHNLSFLGERYSRNLEAKSIHRSRGCLAPSWSWAAIDGPIIYEDWGDHMFEASNFKILDARVDAEIQQAPFGAVRSGWLTVKGGMREIVPSTEVAVLPSTEMVQPGVVYRPDSEEDNKDLYKIMNGRMQGWLLEVASGGGNAKSTTPHWNANMPKGLILVADRADYRRIGLFSLENERDSSFSNTDLSSYFGEPQTITIV